MSTASMSSVDELIDAENGTPGSQKRKGPPTKEGDPQPSGDQRRTVDPAAPRYSQNNTKARAPDQCARRMFFSGVSARHRSHQAWIKMLTIHPNPGPQTRRGRRRGRERPQGGRYVARKIRRDRRRKARRGAQIRDEEVITVATWNLQGVSLRANRMERMRRACQCIQKRGWEVTLLTELRSEAFGTMWLGDGRRRMAVVHSKTTGMAIQGKALRSWVQDGQRVEHGERTTTLSRSR